MSQNVLVVFGGNGYIGQRVCASAVQSGSKVISISRSGLPPQISEEWVQQVQWKKGDISSPSTDLTNIIKGANGAVSCVGAFGSNEVLLNFSIYYN